MDIDGFALWSIDRWRTIHRWRSRFIIHEVRSTSDVMRRSVIVSAASCVAPSVDCALRYDTIRYDTIEEFNVDSKAEYRVAQKK